MHSFFAATRVVWDAPSLAHALREVLAERSVARVAVVLDAALQGCPEVDDAVGAVGAVDVVVRSGGEPDTDEADALTSRLRTAACDAVVGIGGGSVLDLSKAVGGLLGAPGTAADYQGFNLLPGPAVPVVAVPTTAGTGSEVTGAAVMVNRAKQLKLGINSPHIVPAAAVLEPALLVGIPRRLLLSAGMDALSHTIESYSARRATPITRALSVSGYRLLAPALGRALGDPRDRDALRDLLVGATMAGLAVMNAGSGAAHAMAYPLGVHLGVPHSEALTMLMPEVAASIVAQAPGTYAELEADGPGVVTTLRALVEQAQVGIALSDYGSDDPDRALLAAESMKLTSAVESHPVVFTEADALAILSAI